MGCCLCGDEASRQINSNMKMEQLKDEDERKLLLLGTGGSGKSTVFKNLRRIQGETSLDPRAIREAAMTVRQSLVEFMVKLLVKAHSFYQLDPKVYADCLLEDEEKTNEYIRFIWRYEKSTFGLDSDFSDVEMAELGECLAYLWKLSAIKATFAKRCRQFSFPDNLDFFYDKVTEVMSPDYSPNEEEILKIRVRTTGAVMYSYIEQNTKFLITDVGGQRNERRKWMSYFDNLSGVIFVTALNDYNAVLYEDERQNAMHEAVQLFHTYVNIPEFDYTEVILFLNKKDLFMEQLKEVPLSVCFSQNAGWPHEQWQGPDYQQKENQNEDNVHFQECYTKSVDFIKQIFIKRSTVANRFIFIHVTCATNQDNIKTVFWDVQNIIIRSNLRNGGLIN